MLREAHQSISQKKLKAILKLANNVIWSFDFCKKKKYVLGLCVVKEIICDERQKREKKENVWENFLQSVNTKHFRKL